MRARTVLLWVVVLLAGVLAVSGVWLTFTYRPSAAQAWPDVADPSPMQWPRMIHVVATWLIVPASAGLVVASAAVKRAAAPAVGLLVLVIALAYTGLLIAWDQLALWAVIPEGYHGMWTAAFDDRVRFVLIGSVEISQGTLRLWFIVHGAVLAVVLGATLATVIRAGPRRVADKSMSGIGHSPFRRDVTGSHGQG
jgi:quinol-cytochrome oxidoreductase complex cytochrome b subunit